MIKFKILQEAITRAEAGELIRERTGATGDEAKYYVLRTDEEIIRFKNQDEIAEYLKKNNIPY